MQPVCDCIHEVGDAHSYRSTDASACRVTFRWCGWIWTITAGSVPSGHLFYSYLFKMLSCISNLGLKWLWTKRNYGWILFGRFFFLNRFSEFHILEYTITLCQILDANETKLVDGCSRREAADLWSDITSFCVAQGLYNVFNCPFFIIYLFPVYLFRLAFSLLFIALLLFIKLLGCYICSCSVLSVFCSFYTEPKSGRAGSESIKY